MIKIESIEAFTDNYIWLVTTNEGSIVIDPGESSKTINFIKDNQLNLKAILITHHHFDHTGGINEILSHFPVDVFGKSWKTKVFGILNPAKCSRQKVFSSSSDTC